MIQRRQTLYLIFALLLSVAQFFVYISTVKLAEATDSFQLNILSVTSTRSGVTETIAPVYPLLAANILAAALPLVIIFLFRNRALQVKLCRAGLFLMVIFYVLLFYYSDQMQTISGSTDKVTYLAGTYIPAFQLWLFWYAAKLIQRDEELVRSSERLR